MTIWLNIMDSKMNNQPWECPRCGRINASHNPSCFCGPRKDPLLPITKNELLTKIDDMRCPECDGIHGSWRGWPIHCIKA